MARIGVGVGNVLKNVNASYVGVGGIAKRITHGYVGVSELAKLFYIGTPEWKQVSRTSPITGTPTQGATVTTFGGNRAYLGLVGGVNGTTFTNQIHFKLFTQNNDDLGWSIRNLVTARSYPACGRHGGTYETPLATLIMGGTTSTGVNATVESVSNSMVVTGRASLSAAAAYRSRYAWNGTYGIYFPDDANTASAYNASFVRSNPPAKATARSYFATFSVGTYVGIAGGQDIAATLLNSTEFWNASLVRTIGPTFTGARRRIMATGDATRAYLAGGTTAGNAYSNLVSQITSSLSISSATALLNARAASTTAQPPCDCINDYYIFAGGVANFVEGYQGTVKIQLPSSKTGYLNAELAMSFYGKKEVNIVHAGSNNNLEWYTKTV